MSTKTCLMFAVYFLHMNTRVISEQQSCSKDSEEGEETECNKYRQDIIDENQMLIKMPDDEQDLKRMYKEINMNLPALAMAYDSAKIKRSTRQAFILLLGLTGSGKSSTINYLFDKEIAPTSDKRSMTKDSMEFSVSMKSIDKKVLNITLSIIDTPGFADTEGLEQDAKNLASIKQFIEVHPFLKTNFPNLVYLVVKINDNRMFGPDSQLSKLLKGMQLLNAIDKDNNNLVVILSHACSLARNPTKWKEQVEQKIKDVQAHVESFLGIKPDIVAQETEIEDNNLEKDGDWHVLPDGRLQPSQLFKVSKSLLLKSNDAVGYEAFRMCFRPNKNYKITRGLVVSAENVVNDRVLEMKAKLEEKLFSLSDSEITRMLNIYNEEKDEPTLYHDILILKIRLNELELKTPRDLQQKTMNQLKVMMLPTHMTSQMDAVLTELFGLKYEEYSGHLSQIGKGFNPFSDTFTFTVPLELRPGTGGKLGLPNNVLLHKTNTYEIKHQIVKDNNHYIRERLRGLQISYDTGIDYDLFNMNVRSGYNIRDESKQSSQQHVHSFLIEQKLFKYEIQKPFQKSDQLREDITSLPSTYIKHDEENVSTWKRFFEKWGYYVIIGGFLGGSVAGEVTLKQSGENSNNSEEIYRQLATTMSFLQVGGEDKYESNSSDHTAYSSGIATQSLKWTGGDRLVFKNSLEDVSIQDWNKWVNSLQFTPESLFSSLDLYPMYLLVADIDGMKAQEMQKIINLVLGGKFKYEPPKRETRESISPPAESRWCFPADAKVWLSNGTTVLIRDLLIGQFVFSNDFNSFLKEDVVITWLHKVEHESAYFLAIVHDFGTLTISKGHILYEGESRVPKIASELKVGDKIYYHRQPIAGIPGRLVEIRKIEVVHRNGIYAPLTWNGNLIVDGVDVSCYADVRSLKVFGSEVVSSHSIAHFGVLPLRTAYLLGYNIHENKMDIASGIHVFAKWLMDNVLNKLNHVLETGNSCNMASFNCLESFYKIFGI